MYRHGCKFTDTKTDPLFLLIQALIDTNIPVIFKCSILVNTTRTVQITEQVEHRLQKYSTPYYSLHSKYKR